MNKIFFSDIDGTLLTSDKKVTPKTREALSNFVEAGNSFAICTGRDITSSLSVYRSLGLDIKGAYVVAYNGGLIYDIDNSKVIYREGIPIDRVRELLDMAKEYGVHYFS